ncbi:MAG: hypothetical protein KBB91_00565 [Candidatus Pacebacteria bacterium]|nr:hypothetical protein [Candidatus Paceibacterota bacterium]MBP9700836.1 hypothetical protein [Candidatus Paceibacterota bacterium]
MQQNNILDWCESEMDYIRKKLEWAQTLRAIFIVLGLGIYTLIIFTVSFSSAQVQYIQHNTMPIYFMIVTYIGMAIASYKNIFFF